MSDTQRAQKHDFQVNRVFKSADCFTRFMRPQLSSFGFLSGFWHFFHESLCHFGAGTPGRLQKFDPKFKTCKLRVAIYRATKYLSAHLLYAQPNFGAWNRSIVYWIALACRNRPSIPSKDLWSALERSGSWLFVGVETSWVLQILTRTAKTCTFDDCESFFILLR